VLAGKGVDLGHVAYRLGGARGQRRAHAQGHRARAQLVAQQGHGGGRRADPGQACVDHGLGEGGVFGQKAVAGVHGVGAARLCDGDQLADVEVGVGRALAVQGVGFVGHAHVQGVQVVVGIHGHAAQAVVAAGADDAHGDFAPVGDQHFFILGFLGFRQTAPAV
jgi:hypothetical protein